MGLVDFLKRRNSKAKRCAFCKAEDKGLEFTKKFDGETHRFCSKECSRKFRIARKKEKKNPPSTGSSLPW